MLSDKQYEAIGRLALAFNEIEAVIDSYCAPIIGAPEWYVSELFTKSERTFVRKAAPFQQVLDAIVRERQVFQPNVREITRLLRKAEALALERNKYIHALVVIDFQSSLPKVRINHEETEFDREKVMHLAMEAVDLASDLADECAEMLGGLSTVRESN